jgi:ABC-type Zn uptake system ZnuABC Zn-binding protein ZnuA
VPVMLGVLMIGVVLSFVPLWVNNSADDAEQARLIEKYRKTVIVTEKEIIRLRQAILENRLDLPEVENMTTQDWIETIASEMGAGMATVEPGGVSLLKSGSVEGGDYAITVFLKSRDRAGTESVDKTVLRWAN